MSQWPLRKQIIIMKFYNREKEVAELKRVQELAFTQNSRMIVVTGRRRIGKTSLIKEALKERLQFIYSLEEKLKAY